MKLIDRIVYAIRAPMHAAEADLLRSQLADTERQLDVQIEVSRRLCRYARLTPCSAVVLAVQVETEWAAEDVVAEAERILNRAGL